MREYRPCNARYVIGYAYALFRERQYDNAKRVPKNVARIRRTPVLQVENLDRCLGCRTRRPVARRRAVAHGKGRSGGIFTHTPRRQPSAAAPRAAIQPPWTGGSNAPFQRQALQVTPYATPASTSRCSANSLFIQSITARTQAARRRSRWTMIQYSAAISGIGGVSRSSRGWLSPT